MTRKVPSQERSRETVQSILLAGADDLQQAGTKSLTVRAIARRAGISVGTIYQYFGSKEELVESVFREQFAIEWRENMTLARELEACDAPELIERVLRQSLETRARVHELNPEYFEMHEARSALAASNEAIRREAVQFLGEVMRQRLTEFRVRCPEYAVDLLIHGLAAIFREFLLRRPEALRDPRFVQEIVDLVKLYLLAERPD